MTEARHIDLLMVEDTEDDADLLVRQLEKAGYEITSDRVDNAAALEAALRRRAWDVIVSDYNMPTFTGVDALGLVRVRDHDTPFIFVSGTMGEETAVAALRAGAQDYFIKGKTARLPAAIERELKEAQTRRARRVAEEKVRQLSRAVEQSANFVTITDADGVIEYVNPGFANAIGYGAADLVGRRPFFRKLKTEADRELWATTRSGLDWHGEFENVRKDGSLLSVSATVSPVADDQGQITHIIAIEEDVTRRREIEAQLRQAQKMEAVGNLTGGMAHDFNNLLAVVIGNLDILVGQLGSGEPRELAQEALDAAINGADLTKRLLAFARRQPLQPQEIDLPELLSSTVKLIGRLIGKGYEIELQPVADAWPIVVDPSQFAASITNLATNARDAMPGGGRLAIAVANRVLDTGYVQEHPEAKVGEYVEIAVSDSGTGMPPEIVQRIFEPFFTTKETGKGSGLGLAMVYGFVSQSGGHVTVESEPGKGTTFRLFLPRAAMSAPLATSRSDGPEDLDGRGRTVLVVEDVALLRRVVVRQVRELGYKAIEAESIGAALAIMEQQAVDILFTDVIVGEGATGFDLARVVRQRWPSIRVGFTSGFPQAKLNAGSGPPPDARVLIKPYRKEDLARALADL